VTAPWTISAAAERVGLNPRRQGEVTFTVTNNGPVDTRAVCDAVPGENAQRSWFMVDEPQRLVPHGGSTTFLMRFAVPPDAPPGTHWVQGRVYSADSAPEETSVLSNRVSFEVAAAPKPASKPWLWLIPVAVLVLAVLGVVLFLLLRDEDPPPQVTPSPTAAPVPSLTGQTEEQARASLAGLGLVVGTVQHRQAPEAARSVVDQSPTPGQPVAPGTAVDLVIAVKLDPPAVIEPPNGDTLRLGVPVLMRWNAAPDAEQYRLSVDTELCFSVFPASGCVPGERFTETVAGTSFTLNRPFNAPGVRIDQVRVTWSVTALDDFGNPGAAGGPNVFELRR
jgi:hypothetical protein